MFLSAGGDGGGGRVAGRFGGSTTAGIMRRRVSKLCGECCSMGGNYSWGQRGAEEQLGLESIVIMGLLYEHHGAGCCDV